MKIWISVFLLLLSVAAQAGFLQSDFTLKEYSNIRNSVSDNNFIKFQKNMLSNRAAGVFFSMKEESLIRMLTVKNSFWCLTGDTVNTNKLFIELDAQIQSDTENYYQELRFSKAIRKLLIKQNQCK